MQDKDIQQLIKLMRGVRSNTTIIGLMMVLQVLLTLLAIAL